MVERKLAHVEEVASIQPIEGCDNIVLVTVLGWHVIQRKDTVKIGDKVVYIEIDSRVPTNNEAFAFLESRKYKVKTIKMRGCISQGLVMTFDQLGLDSNKYSIGDDMTEKLGITKIETEEEKRLKKDESNSFERAFSSMVARHKSFFKKKTIKKLLKYSWFRKIIFVFLGKKKDKPKAFPSYIHKTDETRVENMPWVLNDGEKQWQASEKIDGCLDKDVSVMTENGPIAISQVVNKRLPCKVLTYNEQLGICEYNEIEEYHKWERVSDMYDVVVSQMGYRCGNRPKHIKCTSEHSFYVGDGKYKKAKDLLQSDTIYHRYESIDSFAMQAILGILLGDGSVSAKDGKVFGSIDFSHSENQSDYFEETCRLLGNGNVGRRVRTSGYGSRMLCAHYTANHDLKEFISNNCYINGKKTITLEWANQLTPISLAFWYMDDGTIQCSDTMKYRPKVSIATNGFSREECLILQDAIDRKFNIHFDIRDKKSYKGNVMYLDTMNAERFFQLIAPYICEPMKYKLPANLRCIKYCLQDYTATNSWIVVPTKIISISKISNYSRKFVYDLTIKNNHNYFACGILTHNTSTTFAIDCRKKKVDFVVCSRNVRQLDMNQETFHDCPNTYWEMAFKYDIKNVLLKFRSKYAKEYPIVILQGETIGESLQGNPYKMNYRDFYAYNLVLCDPSKDIYQRYDSKSAEDLIGEFGVKWVPLLDIVTLPSTMEEMKEQAEGNSVINTNVLREGIVYRSLDGKESFKNVSNTYLMKHQG